MKYLYKIGVLLAFLGLWCGFSSDLVPSPKDSFLAFLEILESGALLVGIKDSSIRYFSGLFFGSFCGILVGFIFGLNPRLNSAFSPLLALFRPISPIAWIPLVLLAFGIGDLPSIFIISYAVFFPLVLLSIKAVKDVPQELIKISKNFGANRFQIIFGLILPNSFLSLISSIKLAASLAWVNLVVGEMLGAQTGLGYLIIDARNQLRVDLILTLICIIGIIGAFINFLCERIESKINKRFGYDKNK